MSVAVDVRDLVESPGSYREVHVREPVEALSTELARVPAERPIDADLRLESVALGVLVSGTLSGLLDESCARCLTPLEREFRVEVQELFAPGPDAGEDEYPIVDGELDLEPMIRDAVVLTLPFAPLCRPDCLGLCERCGGDRNRGECQCPPAQADPRWAALDTIQLPND